jgi:hypothetical protein
MGADVSRVRFDPLRDFAGVVLQQGRLLLDGDFNEYVALLDRRLRAETCDLTSFGPDPSHAGVAWVPRQTPEGFHVTAAGGVLTIGRGRMYVDGLLAENHGVPPLGFDPLLAEPTGTADTPYAKQPYWPNPNSAGWAGFEAPPATGTHLAYLDVWEREVTSLEDPDLVEVAVGVDTTARTQTAWQVRLLTNVGNATCATDDDQIPGWLDVIRPSAGRLTTQTIAVAPDDDPCALPPTGGYRGLENQTYRVEIHVGGAPGTATFKWSRDNGSVAIPVVEMVSTTVLRLATVGKDDVLRISTGDWVEILDDNYEFGRKLGELRKVAVDDAERTITFAGAIPADLRPSSAADAAGRHLRVRRWDQAGVVHNAAGGTVVDLDAPGAKGVITVPTAGSTQIVLESGITVSFSLAAGGSGRFNPGDYWIFAARTADTSIEELTAAPPLGVQHHYARLGTVTMPGSQSDCRRLWPPLGGDGESCDCTVCVTPESHSSGALTIQAAVDQVKGNGGGTVCLEAGVYTVTQPVVADGAISLRIHGQGIGTQVVATGGAFAANVSRGLTIENLAILSGRSGTSAIRLQSAMLADLHDLAILSLGTGGGGAGTAIQLAGAALDVAIRKNVLVGQVGIAAGGDGTDNLGIFGTALRVEDNVVVGADRGIDLGGRSAYFFSCRVSRNEVLAGTSGGIIATGAAGPSGALQVSGNRIGTTGAGITVGPDATIDSNVIDALTADTTPPVTGGTAASAPVLGTDGIVVAAGDFTTQAGHVRITGNHVQDRAGAGIVLRTPVLTWIAKANVVQNVGTGIEIAANGQAERVAVDNNEVLDVAPSAAGADGVFGIAITQVTGSASIVGNTVARVGLNLPAGVARAGILVVAASDVHVTGNVVESVGPLEGFTGLAIGIGVFGPFDTATVSDNTSRFTTGTTGPSEGFWCALRVQSISNSISFGLRRAAVPVGSGTFVFTDGGAFFAAAAPEHVTISANSVAGGGTFPACFVAVSGDVVAQGNQADFTSSLESATAVRLAGTTIGASTNRLRGPNSMLVLQVDPKRLAAVGNLAPGGTHVSDSAGNLTNLGSPWAALNPSV